MQQFPRKEKLFNSPEKMIQYVHETQDSKTLLQKELDVNQAEQLLLVKRVQLMQSFINDLPSTDAQYSMLIGQIRMDQIELNELKIRETLLIQRISES